MLQSKSVCSSEEGIGQQIPRWVFFFPHASQRISPASDVGLGSGATPFRVNICITLSKSGAASLVLSFPIHRCLPPHIWFSSAFAFLTASRIGYRGNFPLQWLPSQFAVTVRFSFSPKTVLQNPAVHPLIGPSFSQCSVIYSFLAAGVWPSTVQRLHVQV